MAKLAWEIFGQQVRSGHDCNNTDEYEGDDDNGHDDDDHDDGDESSSDDD